MNRQRLLTRSATRGLASTSRRAMAARRGASPTTPLSLHSDTGKAKEEKRKRNSFSMVESGSQALEGFKDFVATNAFVLSAWLNQQQQGKLTRRIHIAKTLTLLNDWKVLLPSTLLVLLPGTVILLPAVLSVFPKLLPSWMGKVERIWGYRDRALLRHRQRMGREIRERFKELVVADKEISEGQGKLLKALCEPNTALSKWMYALPHLHTLLQTPSNNKALSRLCCAYLSLPIPSIYPQARLLQYADWVFIKDDGMVRSEGMQMAFGGERLGLMQALWDRGYILQEGEGDTSVKGLEGRLAQHLSVTQKLVKALYDLPALKKAEKAREGGGGEVLDVVLAVLLHVILNTPK